MKCRFPVADIDGITIAVLPCQQNGGRLGLLLHPAPDEAHTLPRQLYYVSWSFLMPTGSGYGAKRLADIGRDAHNLRFRGKPVTAKWRDVYIAAHPPTFFRDSFLTSRLRPSGSLGR